MNHPMAIKEAFAKAEKIGKLVDMKLPPKKFYKEDLATKPEHQREEYPYGLQLRFEHEQIKKMPSLCNYNVGDEVTVSGKGEVIGVRMNEDQSGGERYTVEVQIKKVAIT